jgi:hypothetical protein
MLGSMIPHEIYSGFAPDNGSFFPNVFLPDSNESHDPSISNKTASSKKTARFSKCQPMQVVGSPQELPAANNVNVQLPVTAVDLPTYLLDSTFVNGGFVDGAAAAAPSAGQSNDCQVVSSLTTVFKPVISTAGQGQGQPTNTFSFQTGLPPPAQSSFSAQSGHLHNFDFGMIFSDLTSSSPVIMPPIQSLRLNPPVPPCPPPPPVNFLPISSTFSHHHHQQQQQHNSSSSRTVQSTSIHNLSINSLLGRGQSTLVTQNQMDSSYSEKFHFN